MCISYEWLIPTRSTFDVDIADFSPYWKHIVDHFDSWSLRVLYVFWHSESAEEESFAFVIEAADSSEVIFEGGVFGATETVSHLVAVFETVCWARNRVIILASRPFSTAPTCKIDTKPFCPLFIKSICFSVTCLQFWITLMQGWHSFRFLMLVHIGQVLIIPDIVLIVTFKVCDVILFSVSHL